MLEFLWAVFSHRDLELDWEEDFEAVKEIEGMNRFCLFENIEIVVEFMDVRFEVSNIFSRSLDDRAVFSEVCLVWKDYFGREIVLFETVMAISDIAENCCTAVNWFYFRMRRGLARIVVGGVESGRGIRCFESFHWNGLRR